jgi:hypothetical protein
MERPRSRARTVLLAALVAGCAQSPRAERAPPPLPESALLPASVRRLTAHELERTYSDLLGFPVEIATRLASDVRQNGFTPNDAAAVTPLFAAELHAALGGLADSATRDHLSELVPCAANADSACAESFIADFGARAFRRALTSDERARYRALFDAGSADGDFSSGIALVLATLLESPNLLYLSELGQTTLSAPGALLSSDEIASVLAYSVSGGAPDAELRAAAANGALASADGREQAARRLLARSDTRAQYERFVLEWLGLDGLTELAKDGEKYPEFDTLRPYMRAETLAFVDRALTGDGGSLAAFFADGINATPAELRDFYGLAPDDTDAHALLGVGRPGILQQASFLAVHSHPSDSGPVLRGATVLRRVLCRSLPSPFELGVEIVPPPPDPSATTRERFAAHASDPACTACHATIDGIGFSFEGFDAIGRRRTSEAGKPVDTSGTLSDDSGNLALADSAELSRALAGDPEAAECLARQVFRYFSGRDQPAAEDAFVATLAGEPADRSVIGLVIALVRSELFVRRSLE